jgi:hypothetical protein
MPFKFLHITVLLISALIVVSGQHTDGDCVARAGDIFDCFQYISSNFKNAKFITDRSAYGDQCSPIRLFWN